MTSLVYNALAQQCPLCGERNECAQVKAQATGQPPEVCWCFGQSIPAEVLEKLPATSRGVQCICQLCASAQSAKSIQSDAA